MTTAAVGRDASWHERSATFAIFLALGIALGTWAAAIPALKQNLGMSAAELSVALLVLAFASTFSTLATGAIAPRLGTGRSTGAAAAANVVAFALPALAGSALQLTLCAAVIGLAVGALDIAMNAHASDIERRWRAPIMSSFHGAFSLGGLLGASLGGLIAWAGWGVAGQIYVPILGAALVMAAAGPHLGHGLRQPAGQRVVLALPSRKALPLCAIALLCLLLEGAMADWSAVYLETVTDATAWASAAGYAAFSVAMAAGRLVGDRVVGRLGPRRTVFFGCAVATAGATLAFAVTDPLWGSVGFGLIGIGASNVIPVVVSGAGRYGATPAAGVAMVATCGYAGFVGGPPLIGAVATVAGLRAAMLVIALAPLLAMVASLRLEPAPDAPSD